MFNDFRSKFMKKIRLTIQNKFFASMYNEIVTKKRYARLLKKFNFVLEKSNDKNMNYNHLNITNINRILKWKSIFVFNNCENIAKEIFLQWTFRFWYWSTYRIFVRLITQKCYNFDNDRIASCNIWTRKKIFLSTTMRQRSNCEYFLYSYKQN